MSAWLFHGLGARLAHHAAKWPISRPAHGWLFPNTIGGALDLHNLAERVIKPRFKEKSLHWKGWHAYRRGLATNLHALGVDDKTIQAILRHEDVTTTQRSYIKTPSQIVTDAMAKLEAKIGPCDTWETNWRFRRGKLKKINSKPT